VGLLVEHVDAPARQAPQVAGLVFAEVEHVVLFFYLRVGLVVVEVFAVGVDEVEAVERADPHVAVAVFVHRPGHLVAQAVLVVGGMWCVKVPVPGGTRSGQVGTDPQVALAVGRHRQNVFGKQFGVKRPELPPPAGRR
jgi:hypothetical protein